MAIFMDAIKHLNGFMCFSTLFSLNMIHCGRNILQQQKYRNVDVLTVLYSCIKSIFSKRDVLSECAGTVKPVLELRYVCIQIPFVPYTNYLCIWMSSYKTDLDCSMFRILD